MQLKNLLTCLVFGLTIATQLSAQSSASLDSKQLTLQNPESFTIGNDEWAFYLDMESKVYYIDFESISVNLSDIKVYDVQGSVVKSDKLWDLPVNTIYELDLNDLKPGRYKVELRSYTGVIQKDVTLSE